MSRGIRWTGAAGLVLVVVGMILVGSAPSAGTAMVVVGLILLGSLTFVVSAKARRTRGWTRVWNPGAARREYEAEQARQGHDSDVKPTAGDEQKR